MVQPARVVLGVGKAEGVADRAGELSRLLAHPQGLLRISQLPQGQRQIAAMRYSGIFADTRRPQSACVHDRHSAKGLFHIGRGRRRNRLGKTASRPTGRVPPSRCRDPRSARQGRSLLWRGPSTSPSRHGPRARRNCPTPRRRAEAVALFVRRARAHARRPGRLRGLRSRARRCRPCREDSGVAVPAHRARGRSGRP